MARGEGGGKRKQADQAWLRGRTCGERVCPAVVPVTWWPGRCSGNPAPPRITPPALPRLFPPLRDRADSGRGIPLDHPVHLRPVPPVRSPAPSAPRNHAWSACFLFPPPSPRATHTPLPHPCAQPSFPPLALRGTLPDHPPPYASPSPASSV